jgi:single-strand DNA-binding protein
MYKFKGTIKHIGDIQTFGEKGFSKQDLVLVESDAKYPQTVKFELTKDNTKLTTGYKIGEEVEVKFNIKGREYNNNYYVSLEAYKLIATAFKSSEPKSLMIESETGVDFPF